MKKILLFVVVGAIITLYYYIHKNNDPIKETIEIVDEDCDESESDIVEDLANRLHRYVKAQDIDSLASLFLYPIARKYPTRDILDEREFKERYKEIFDEELCNTIINNPKDWFPATWRGYAYGSWDFIADYGDRYIYSVNAYSHLAEELHEEAIKVERSKLHPDIKVYATTPVCSFKTKDGEWYGRVDYVFPTNNVDVQLALYRSTTSIDMPPDHLFLGKEDVQGSVMNTYYVFRGCFGDSDVVIENPTVWEFNKYPYKLIFVREYGESQEESYDIDFVYWVDLFEDYLL